MLMTLNDLERTHYTEQCRGFSAVTELHVGRLPYL